MIDAEVKARADGRFDLYIRDGGNYEDLANSNQGYERAVRAEELAHRLFGPDGNAAAIKQISKLLEDHPDQTPLVAQLRTIIANRTPPEPVELTVSGRLGGRKRVQLR